MKNRLTPSVTTLTTAIRSQSFGIYTSLLLASLAQATTLHVPADYASIQAAVDAASPSGDEILIAPGLYNQQVVINAKQLTLTGSTGTVLSAWTGMRLNTRGPSYNLLLIDTNADVVVRNIDFEGNRLAQSMPNSAAIFEGLLFWSAGGRVEHCTIAGFRGTNKLATGPGHVLAGGLGGFNPLPSGTGVVNLQILHNTFTDNGVSVFLGGDADRFVNPNPNPSLLRMTVVIEGNTITGVGPTSLDSQSGVFIFQGASGLVKGNRVSNFYDTDPTGNWSIGLWASIDCCPVPLKPLRFEGNSLIGNQVALVAAWADNSQFINNYFEGPAGLDSNGIYGNGTNMLAALNYFTNLTQGIVLADPNDPNLPPATAFNPTLLANQFCTVTIPVLVEPLVTGETEVGSQTCPFPPAGFGNLTCSPAAGLPGSTVSLSGTNLSGATMVLFNGASASFSNSAADADQLITAIVPDHATTGPVTVLTPQGNITSLAPFTVPVLLAMTLPTTSRVQLSWSADASDMLLENTTDLAAPNWQTVSTSPAISSNQVNWIGPQTAGAQFFRLRQP